MADVLQGEGGVGTVPEEVDTLETAATANRSGCADAPRESTGCR